jgi:hypothetical protein
LHICKSDFRIYTSTTLLAILYIIVTHCTFFAPANFLIRASVCRRRFCCPSRFLMEFLSKLSVSETFVSSRIEQARSLFTPTLFLQLLYLPFIPLLHKSSNISPSSQSLAESQLLIYSSWSLTMHLRFLETTMNLSKDGQL